MLKLILIFVGVNNCYWITIYNVTKLDGNKFINGVILGIAELCSGIVAGGVISYTSPSIALQICAVAAISFNALNQFVVPFGSLLSYTTLAIAILGVGGTYTCIYVLIGLVVPSEQVGGAMVFIVTMGAFASLCAPLVVIFDTPVPFIVLAAMMSFASILTCLLPKECPDKVREQEDHLMDGWIEQHNTSIVSPRKEQANKQNFNSQLMNMKEDIKASRQQASSFAIYAARGGYINAVNSSMYQVNHTRDQSISRLNRTGNVRLQHSLSLAKRYHPNPGDMDSRM